MCHTIGMDAAAIITNQTLILCSFSLLPLALISRTQLQTQLPAEA
jgi:hypothetical protein